MNRPYIVCHMLTALDGKITGPFMESPAVIPAGEEYERTNELYHPQAWLCGRVTTDENFTFYRQPDLDETSPAVPDERAGTRGAGRRAPPPRADSIRPAGLKTKDV